MSEIWYRPTNTYQRILLWGGGGLLAIGLVIGAAGKSAFDSAVRGAEIYAVLAGSFFVDYSRAEAPAAWMWFGVTVAVVGAVLIIVWVSIRAARTS
jgi:hypothetical protein